MAIQDDWSIDYLNKRIFHSAGTTVYSVNALYSYLMDTFDELGQMDDQSPMTAQTPTAYRLENGWFLDNDSTQFLDGGAISTLGWDASTENDGVRVFTFQAGGYINAVAGDIGREVGYSGGTPADTGTLLAYDNTLRKWWVRVDDTGDTFANTGTALDLDDGTGTGAGTLSVASTTGEALWVNVFTLGTIVDDSQIYIKQSGTSLYNTPNGDVLDSWWVEGQIDVLIQIQEAGVETDNGNLTVFARKYGNTYDHFILDASSGGRQAVPLATAEDLDNTSSQYYMIVDGFQNGGLAVGNRVGDTSDITTATWSGYVSEYIELIASSTHLVGIEGVRDTANFTDNDAVFLIGGTQRGTLSGTPGGVAFAYDNEATGPFTVGNTLTNTSVANPEGGNATAVIRGLLDGGTFGVIVAESAIGHFNDNDALTEGSVTANVDLTGTNYSNMDSEQLAVAGYSVDIGIYQVTGDLVIGSASGTFENYERILGGTSGHEAYVIYHDGATDLIIANATGQFQAAETITGQESGVTASVTTILDETVTTATKDLNNGGGAQPYDVFIDLNKTEISSEKSTVQRMYEYLKHVTAKESVFQVYDSDAVSAVAIVNGEEYISADYAEASPSYAVEKRSPFGTFAGGKFFSAVSVFIENVADADIQNFQLIDANGVTQIPPNKQTLEVTSVVAGDRVAILPRLGSDGVEKTQFTSSATGNNAGDSDLVIQEVIPGDTPIGKASGGNQFAYAIVVDDAGEEHRYRYNSFAASTFTFPVALTGTATGGTTSQLVDTGANFQTGDLEVGDIIYDATNGEFAYVISIDAADTVTTTAKTTTWSGASYETNSLVTTYTGADTVYVPYLLTTADGTTASEILTVSLARNILIRVRKKGIIPFEIASTFGPDNGRSVAAIRTTDSIVI